MTDQQLMPSPIGSFPSASLQYLALRVSTNTKPRCFFSCRGLECEPFCAHSVFRRKVCWVQHSSDAPANVSSMNTLLSLALRGCLFPHDHSFCLVLLFSAPVPVERSSDDRRFCPATMSSPDPCGVFSTTPSSPCEGSVRLPERICLLCCFSRCSA